MEMAPVNLPTVRAYYNLEELWGGQGPARVRKATASDEAAGKAPAAGA